jgi:SAM-dependent methyltransferase
MILEEHRLWASVYDVLPNPLLALEMRLLAPLIGSVDGKLVLDAGCGTGRWMEWLTARGANVVGIDICMEMVLTGREKRGVSGRAALGDIRKIPLKNNAVDLALCSFAIAYPPATCAAMLELGRVARQLIVTDLHPEAVRQGWKRSFRAGGKSVELTHNKYSLAELDEAAELAGLTPRWRVDGCFGTPELQFFEKAGREAVFEAARQVPAVVISAWDKSSS